MTPPKRRPRTPDEPKPTAVKHTAGDATWKEHRSEIAKRNAETKKRAQAERVSRDGIAGAKVRAEAKHEAEQLRELNARIEKRRRGR